ncbi:hypothetical protein Tco_0022526, partial [Tanacetum coccineum]
MIFDEMKLTENYRSHDELKAKKNVQKVEEHLIAEEIEKLVEGAENVENVEVDSSTLRKDDTQAAPGKEEESAEDDYEFKRREKGKHVEESRSTSSPTKIRSLRTYSTPISSYTEKLQELMPGRFKQYRSFFDELQGRYGYLSKNLKTRFMPRKKFNVLAQHLKEIMEDSLTTMGLIMERQHKQEDVAKMIADTIQQERESLRADISLQINNGITNHIPSQVDSSVRNYMSGHILHV